MAAPSLSTSERALGPGSSQDVSHPRRTMVVSNAAPPTREVPMFNPKNRVRVRAIMPFRRGLNTAII